MNVIEKFKNKMSDLDRKKIRVEEQLNISTKRSNEMKEELITITGASSYEEAVEIAKKMKVNFTTKKAEINEKVAEFLKKVG